MNEETRQKIRQINANPSLTKEQKTREIQKILHPQHDSTPHPQDPQTHNQNNLYDPCTHYTESKKCHKFRFTCCERIDPCVRCHKANSPHCSGIQVAEIECKECHTRQSPSNQCINTNCMIYFNRSYCPTCYIWSHHSIHHCNDCGLCRVKPSETEMIHHCHTCGVCFDNITAHECPKYRFCEQTCYFCQENVNNSQKKCIIMNCEHLAHLDCTTEAFRKGIYRCPLCRKSIQNMQDYWDEIDASIEQQTMPLYDIRPDAPFETPFGPIRVIRQMTNNIVYAQFANWSLGKIYVHKDVMSNPLVAIQCIDCEQKSHTDFHWNGLKCWECGGYNTQKI